MTLAEQTARDLLNIISDAPLTFTFDSVEYEDGATRGALINSQRLMEGGFMGEPDLSITTCLKKLNGVASEAHCCCPCGHDDPGCDLIDRFSSDPPAVGEIITVDDVDYRIDRIHTDEFSLGVQYDLVSRHLGSEGHR